MQEIKELTNSLRRIEAQQAEMSNVLSGNEKYGTHGMKHELIDIKEQIKAIVEDRKTEGKKIWRWIGISAFGSSVITTASIKLGIGKVFAVFLKLLGI